MTKRLTLEDSGLDLLSRDLLTNTHQTFFMREEGFVLGKRRNGLAGLLCNMPGNWHEGGKHGRELSEPH